MYEEQPNNREWAFSKEWPHGIIPKPLLTPIVQLNVSVLDLETLVELHERMAIDNHSQHDHEGALLHRARASYLRKRLAAVTPHELTPDRTDTV
jgi:hypothetical protein